MLICACVCLAGGSGWVGGGGEWGGTEGVPQENWGETPWQLRRDLLERGVEGGEGGAPIHLTPTLKEPNDKD